MTLFYFIFSNDLLTFVNIFCKEFELIFLFFIFLLFIRFLRFYCWTGRLTWNASIILFFYYYFFWGVSWSWTLDLYFLIILNWFLSNFPFFYYSHFYNSRWNRLLLIFIIKLLFIDWRTNQRFFIFPIFILIASVSHLISIDLRARRRNFK